MRCRRLVKVWLNILKGFWMSCNNKYFETDKNFFEEHLEFVKIDQKRHNPDLSTEKATYYRKTRPS